MEVATVERPTEATQEEWITADYKDAGIHIAFTEGVGEKPKRRYLVNGEKWPSVTTILDKHLARGGLAYWYQQMAVAGMVEMQIQTGEIPTDPDVALKALYAYGLTADQNRNQAGLDGRILHTALENWHTYHEVPSLTLVRPEKRGKVQALARALIELEPDIVGSEVMVASKRYRYAGRYDARVTFYKPTPAWVQVTADHDRVERRVIRPGTYLMDIKSGNKLHNDHGLQLALYAQASEECGYARTRGTFALHLRDDGTYAVRFYGHRRRAATMLVEAYYAFMEGNDASTRLCKSLEVAA